ncbi:ArsR/SmtB family transcription factor [Mesobacterium pallidum]|uniref:ArsR/SmtB family transcription factor n=1 Tax=Mesobacterium pallidum TaxID=2872037 RepID=UPI001EE32DCC|nr:metalloregulator ArsR/SmtB family transcription factor [Mesobacterium pallidum]
MDNNLNAFFAALSDPTRRAVIERLTQGPAPVSELHGGHDMALPSFLKHLGKLEAAGLVRSEKTGRVRTVHLEAAPLAAAEHWLHRQHRLWERRLDRLTALAETLEKESDHARFQDPDA